MKYGIKFIFIIFICLTMNISNAFSQETCPVNIADIKDDLRFEKSPSTDLFYFLKRIEPLATRPIQTCTYHKNGKLSYERPYNGYAKSYDEIGRLRSESPVKDGELNGISKEYDENGRLVQETHYRNNVRNGALKRYLPNGKLFATVTYANDVPVSAICHNKNGTTRTWTNAELTNWHNGFTVTCD